MKAFNINNEVKVKLTEHALSVYRKKWQSLYDTYPQVIGAYEPPAIDNEGWSTFQLWELMSTFGSDCFNGSPQLFVDNVIQFSWNDEPIDATKHWLDIMRVKDEMLKKTSEQLREFEDLLDEGLQVFGNCIEPRDMRYKDKVRAAIDKYNLPNEVPPLVEPEQFKPGDWVVDNETGEVARVNTSKYDPQYKGHFLHFIGKGYVNARRFRRATPAEVAAYKQAQEPQPDDSHSPLACSHMNPCDCMIRQWVGKCPHDRVDYTKTAPDLAEKLDEFMAEHKQELLDALNKPQPDADKPITDWVEVVTR